MLELEFPGLTEAECVLFKLQFLKISSTHCFTLGAMTMIMSLYFGGETYV